MDNLTGASREFFGSPAVIANKFLLLIRYVNLMHVDLLVLPICINPRKYWCNKISHLVCLRLKTMNFQLKMFLSLDYSKV